MVLVAGGVAVAVAAGVTGCGTAEKLSARDSVTEAVDAVGKARTASFTLSLDSTVADLRRLEEDGTTPDATLKQLLDGDVTVTVTAPDGSTLQELATRRAAQQESTDLATMLKDPAKLQAYLKAQGSGAVAVRLGGAALIELRSVGTTVYARADVRKLLTLAGQDPSMVDAYTKQLPPSLQPLAKAAKGEWIAVDLVEAARSLGSTGLLNRLPKQQASSVDPAAVTRLMQHLHDAYRTKARITDLGEGERGTGYRLTAPAKQVVQAIEPDLIALAGTSAADVKKGIAQMPDRDVSADVWVKDDAVSAVSIDLAQFAEKPVEAKVALDIAVDVDAEPVAAPSGAAKLDVAEALIGLGGAMGGM
jgi:hypothetical protein